MLSPDLAGSGSTHIHPAEIVDVLLPALDIGMDPLSVFLAFLRRACRWGNALTNGICVTPAFQRSITSFVRPIEPP